MCPMIECTTAVRLTEDSWLNVYMDADHRVSFSKRVCYQRKQVLDFAGGTSRAETLLGACPNHRIEKGGPAYKTLLNLGPPLRPILGFGLSGVFVLRGPMLWTSGLTKNVRLGVIAHVFTDTRTGLRLRNLIPVTIICTYGKQCGSGVLVI